MPAHAAPTVTVMILSEPLSATAELANDATPPSTVTWPTAAVVRAPLLMPVMVNVSLPAPTGSLRVTVVEPGTVAGASGSLNVITTVSPGSARPAMVPPVSVIVTAAGPALSSGVSVVKAPRLPAASRAPAALDAIATVIVPTVVSAAPAPSVSVSVSVAVARLTLVSVPPEGTLVSVHGAVPAE